MIFLVSMHPPATIDTQVLTCDPAGGFATKIVYGLGNFLRFNPTLETLVIQNELGIFLQLVSPDLAFQLSRNGTRTD
jgi:hypothetical protein